MIMAIIHSNTPFFVNMRITTNTRRRITLPDITICDSNIYSLMVPSKSLSPKIMRVTPPSTSVPHIHSPAQFPDPDPPPHPIPSPTRIMFPQPLPQAYMISAPQGFGAVSMHVADLGVPALRRGDARS
jgi:hypothetical protein